MQRKRFRNHAGETAVVSLASTDSRSAALGCATLRREREREREARARSRERERYERALLGSRGAGSVSHAIRSAFRETQTRERLVRFQSKREREPLRCPDEPLGCPRRPRVSNESLISAQRVGNNTPASAALRVVNLRRRLGQQSAGLRGLIYGLLSCSKRGSKLGAPWETAFPQRQPRHARRAAGVVVLPPHRQPRRQAVRLEVACDPRDETFDVGDFSRTRGSAKHTDAAASVTQYARLARPRDLPPERTLLEAITLF